jgi:hypothetical protein
MNSGIKEIDLGEGWQSWLEHRTYYTNKLMAVAVAQIDAKFGSGYAKANPCLIGTWMEICQGGSDEGLEKLLRRLLTKSPMQSSRQATQSPR